MITEIQLASCESKLGPDAEEVTIEWLVVSDCLSDFAATITEQGTVNAMIVNGEAKGWLEAGSPYQLGNDSLPECLAGAVEVFGRHNIRGTGVYEFIIEGTGIKFKIKPSVNPRILWQARQQFSTKNEEPPGDETSEDDSFTYRLSYEYEDLPFEFDMVDGKRVENSAGMMFNPPSIRRRKIPIHSITRKERMNPLVNSLVFANTVNSLPLWGVVPGGMLMDSIVFDFDGNNPWFTVTYNIKEKPEGWGVKILDTGYYGRLPNGAMFPIIGDDGLPVSEPAKLNGYGLPIDTSLPGVSLPPGGGLWDKFRKYQALDFTWLRMPNPFLLKPKS